MKKPMRVAVTGAAGQIGYSLLFRIASGEMLGKDQPVILQLLEIPDEKAQKALTGVMMELDDCAFPLLQGMIPASDPTIAFRDVDVALLVGARPRGPGMERKDLLEANGKIFGPQGKALDAVANRNVKVLVVGNPAAQKAGKPVTAVKKMTVWGNHSATQYPDVYNAEVDGQNAAKLINDQKWIEGTLIPTVQKRGAAIIEARGLSSAASAANAAIEHVRDWLLGTPSGDWVSMGVAADGSYGIPEGVLFGYPVTCKNGEYQIVQNLTIGDFSRSRIVTTYKELLEERAAIENLLR